MKTISKVAATLISDFSAETELSLPAYALEKDHHVLDAIKIVSMMPPSAHFRLVFCGGTCLSKAYGILERMSEDVDFKVVPTEAGGVLGTAALRREMGIYVKSIAAALEAGGFGTDAVLRRSRDDNKYSALDISYGSVFEKPDSLRPHLLFELNYTTLADETATLPIGALFDRLAFGAYRDPIDIECVSLREALAEKLVSFPRRLAMRLSKMAPGASLADQPGWDQALVRHVYDVNRIVEAHPDFLRHPEATCRLVARAISTDAGEFASQHPAFALAPRAELVGALVWAKTSKELAGQYDRFVADMVYAPTDKVATYARSTLMFESLLEGILAHIPDRDLVPAAKPVRKAPAQDPNR
ncbi:MAG: nucleotidyl transferase AbiEii/AbiGii toxin family protein [Pseudomonadota bacterium]